MTWATRAACRGTPTAMWFPRAASQYPAAQWYCDRCPVRRECLEEALRIEPADRRYGMRAGLNPRERDDIARGDAPVPEFPPPLPFPAAPTIQRPEGAPAVSITDITATPKQDPAGGIPATADALIEWGAAQESSRLQALAGKARAALTDLRQAAARESKVSAAEARIGRLKAQLANAEKDLRAAKGTPAAAKSGSTSKPGPAEDYPAIRAWARANGVAVGAVGRPSNAVIEAYHAAQAREVA